VDVTPGEGRVDFEGVFRALWQGGFRGGSCIIETLGPKAPAETTKAGTRALRYIADIMTKVGYQL
jgi:sugar phosphate isomerase/epimerase